MQIDKKKPENPAPLRILRMRQLSIYVGLAKSTIYELITKGKFPAATVRFSARAVGWDIADIDAWLNTKCAAH